LIAAPFPFDCVDADGLEIGLITLHFARAAAIDPGRRDAAARARRAVRAASAFLEQSGRQGALIERAELLCVHAADREVRHAEEAGTLVDIAFGIDPEMVRVVEATGAESETIERCAIAGCRDSVGKLHDDLGHVVAQPRTSARARFDGRGEAAYRRL